MDRQANRFWWVEKTLRISVGLLAIAGLFTGTGFAQTAVEQKPNIESNTTGSTQFGIYGREVVAGEIPRIDHMGTHGLGLMDLRADGTCSVGRRTFFNRIIPHFTGSTAHMPPGTTEPAISFHVSDIFRLVHRRKSK